MNTATMCSILNRRITFLENRIEDFRKYGSRNEYDKKEVEALKYALQFTPVSSEVEFESLAEELLTCKGMLFAHLDGTFPIDWQSVWFVLSTMLGKCSVRQQSAPALVTALLKFAGKAEDQYLHDVYETLIQLTHDQILNERFGEITCLADYAIILKEETPRLLEAFSPKATT